ncbi:MAG: HEAT repeat domain-containing protein [Myxococcota bacterium]
MKKLWFVGVVGLCALSFLAGTRLDGPPETVGVAVTEPAPEPEWREAVRVARAAADGATARGQALALLDDSTGDAGLIRALQLLAPVALPEDVPVIESLARTGDARISPRAVDALALIGSPEAVRILSDLSERHTTRGPALEALGATGSPEALAKLTAALDDPTVQHHAATGLVALGTPEAANVLIERFESSIDWQASTWAEYLAAMPADREDARASLMKAARTGPELRKEAAMSALARHRDPAIYGLLAGRAALGDGAAIRALGRLDDARAIDTLKDLVRRGGAPATTAVDALGSMRHPEAQAVLLDVIETGTETLALQAIYMVQNLDQPAVLGTFLWAAQESRSSVAQGARTRLMQHSWGPRVPVEVLDLARERLGSFDPDPGSTLTLLLHYGSSEDHRRVQELVLEGPQQTRLAAVWTLQNLQTRESSDLLVRLVDDPDPYVSSQAIAAAIARGGLETRVESALLARLDEDPSSVSALAYQLVQLNTPAALLRLEDLVRDGTETEQSVALAALMSSSDTTILNRLVVDAKRLPANLQSQIYSSALYNPAIDPTDLADRVLEYGDPSIHYVAVEALANAGTPSAARRLLAMSYDDSTRDAALNGLARVGGPKAEERLLSAARDPATASTAIGALQTLGTPSARAAIADVARGSGPSEARVQALYSLQSAPGRDAQEAFIDAAFDRDANVRRAAIDGLASVGTREAGETLGALLDGEDAEAAAYALQRLGGRAYREHQDRIQELLQIQADDGLWTPNEPDILPVDAYFDEW